MPQTAPANAISPELDHFITIARRGHHPAASGGEKRAHRLAKAILEHCPGIDGMALCGAAELIHLASAAPETCRQVLRM